MKTKYIIAVALVVVAAGGIFFSMQRQASPVQTTETARTDTTPQEQNMNGVKSVRELMALGASSNMQCSYVSMDGTTKTEGNTYVSGGKVRTDSTITVGTAEPMTSSSIIDGDMMYAWGSAMPTGMKMSLTAMSDMKSTAGASASNANGAEQTADIDAKYDYQCSSWAVDPAVFVPPADITFTDYSEMMQGMQDKMQQMQGGNDAAMFEGEVMGGVSGAPSKEMLCSACDRAPDPESKAQCRAVAGCE